MRVAQVIRELLGLCPNALKKRPGRSRSLYWPPGPWAHHPPGPRHLPPWLPSRTGKKESIHGDVVVWRPLTWALAVLIIPLNFLAIYVFSRKEIFDANT